MQTENRHNLANFSIVMLYVKREREREYRCMKTRGAYAREREYRCIKTRGVYERERERDA